MGEFYSFAGEHYFLAFSLAVIFTESVIRLSWSLLHYGAVVLRGWPPAGSPARPESSLSEELVEVEG